MSFRIQLFLISMVPVFSVGPPLKKSVACGGSMKMMRLRWGLFAVVDAVDPNLIYLSDPDPEDKGHVPLCLAPGVHP